MSQPGSLFAFDGARRIAVGSYAEVATEVSAYLQDKPEAQPLMFDADSGKQIDLDLRGVAAELRASAAASLDTSPKASKGRPKLGVVAREVTLLPRHWDWLAQQPGGASASLRRLIERASKAPQAEDQRQARAAAAYHFMHAVAGNLPGFEEAARLLFAGNLAGLRTAVAAWPGDIGAQVLALAHAEEPEAAG